MGEQPCSRAKKIHTMNCRVAEGSSYGKALDLERGTGRRKVTLAMVCSESRSPSSREVHVVRRTGRIGRVASVQNNNGSDGVKYEWIPAETR